MAKTTSAKSNENKTNTAKEMEANDTKNSVSLDISKELQETQAKNAELENKVDKLTQMLEKLLIKSETITEEIDNKPTTKSNGFASYINIEPTKRVLLVNMMTAGGTFITHNNRHVRFDHFGHIQPVRFEDLESLVSKYRDYFEKLEIRILDDEVVNALYLRESYNKYDISTEEMEDMINLNPQDLIKKIKSLNTALQESALSLIIMNVAKNNSKYMDKNKWDVINNAFNINIQEFANRYMIK